MASATVTEGPAPLRRWLRLPKFLLAIPAWAWWVFFFLVPVALVVAASFGSKIEGSAGRVSYDHLNLDNYRQALEGGLSGLFVDVLKQGMRTTLIGTFLCVVVAFPIA